MEVTLEILSIILAIVAILFSVIGFFASLGFYREGVQLETRAQNILARIEEKVGSIQDQVGGMFVRTLDAAIGRTDPVEAAEAQGRLLRRVDGGRTAEDRPAVGPLALNGESLSQDAMQFFAFRGLRFSDVSTDDARAIFSLGYPFGFNLFDGPERILFFGYFHNQDDKRIATSVRFLLENIGRAYTKLGEAALEVRKNATAILDQIAISVLVPDDIDKEQLQAVCEQYQPDKPVELELLTPADLRAALDRERAQMWEE